MYLLIYLFTRNEKQNKYFIYKIQTFKVQKGFWKTWSTYLIQTPFVNNNLNIGTFIKS